MIEIIKSLFARLRAAPVTTFAGCHVAGSRAIKLHVLLTSPRRRLG